MSVTEPSQRKSSTSSSHGEGKGDGVGRGTRFWSGGTGGALRLPDPPAPGAWRLRAILVLSRAGCRQNPEDVIILKDIKYQNLKPNLQVCGFLWVQLSTSIWNYDWGNLGDVCPFSQNWVHVCTDAPAGCNANLRGPTWQDAAGIFSTWKHCWEVHTVNAAQPWNRQTGGQTVPTSKPEDMKDENDLSRRMSRVNSLSWKLCFYFTPESLFWGK